LPADSPPPAPDRTSDAQTASVSSWHLHTPWFAAFVVATAIATAATTIAVTQPYRDEPHEAEAAAVDEGSVEGHLQDRVADLEQRLRSIEFLGDTEPEPGGRTLFVIESASPLPDAATSPYPDCIQVSVARVIDPAKGSGREQDEEILVASLGFRGHALVPPLVRSGTRYRARLVPWSELGPEVRSVQQADTTERFDLPLFAAIDLDLPASRPVRFEPPTDLTTPPTPAEAIDGLRAEIRARLAPHGDFDAWTNEVRPRIDELRRRLAEAGGMLDDGSGRCITNTYTLEHAPPGEEWPTPQLTTLLSMQRQLAERGIDLIVVPFPRMEHVDGWRFVTDPPEDEILDPRREQLLLALLDAGIEVVDALPALREASDDDPLLYYDAADGHPADGATRVVADAIAARLRRYGFERALDPIHTQRVLYGIEEKHEKFPPHARLEDAYRATRVLIGEDLAPVPWSKRSPILMCGDSYLNAPSFFGVTSASVPAHVTKHIGQYTMRISRGSGGPRILEDFAKKPPAYFDGVRVCVLVMQTQPMFHRSAKPTTTWVDARIGQGR
jgi:hypothetical protein